LLVEGVTVPVTTPLALHQGWNWTGYLPQATMPVTVALQSITGAYQRVLSLNQYYDVRYPGFSTLKQMSAGQGYLIYATQVATLTYPSAQMAFGEPISTAPAAMPQHQCDVSPTPYLTLVYGHITVNGQPAPLGTRVDVVTPRGEVAGCFVVERAGQYGFVHVYGADDTAEPPIPGFLEGEALDFRVNGIPANASIGLAWQDDKAPHEVDLEAMIHSVYLPLILKSR
jgi:hypothetical protein